MQHRPAALAVALAALLALIIGASCSQRSRLPISSEESAQISADNFVTTRDTTTPESLADAPVPQSQVGQRIAHLRAEGVQRLRALDRDYDANEQAIRRRSIPRSWIEQEIETLIKQYTKDRTNLQVANVSTLRLLSEELRKTVDELSTAERAAIAIHILNHGIVSTKKDMRVLEAALWHVLAVHVFPKDSWGFVAPRGEQSADSRATSGSAPWPQRVASSAILALVGNSAITLDDFIFLLRDRSVLEDLKHAEFSSILGSLLKTARGTTLVRDILADGRSKHASRIALAVADYFADAQTAERPLADSMFDTAVAYLATHHAQPARWLPAVWRSVVDCPHATVCENAHIDLKVTAIRRLASLLRHAPVGLARAAVDGLLAHDRTTHFGYVPLSRSASHYALQTHVSLVAVIFIALDIPENTLQHALLLGDKRGADDDVFGVRESQSESPVYDALASTDIMPSESWKSVNSATSQSSKHGVSMRSEIIRNVLRDANGISATLLLAAADIVLGALRYLKNEHADFVSLPVHIPRPFFDAVFVAANHARMEAISPPNTKKTHKPETAVHLIVRSAWSNTARMIFERLNIVSDIGEMPRAVYTRLDRSEDVARLDGAFAVWQERHENVYSFTRTSYDEALRLVALGPCEGTQDGGMSETEDTTDYHKTHASQTSTSRRLAMERRQSEQQAAALSSAKNRHASLLSSRSDVHFKVSKATSLGNMSMDATISAKNGRDLDSTVQGLNDSEGQFTLQHGISSLSMDRCPTPPSDDEIMLHAQSIEEEMSATAHTQPPLLVQHYDTLIEALATHMDRVFLLHMPRQSNFFSTMRHSMRIQRVAERIKVIKNPGRHGIAARAWSGPRENMPTPPDQLPDERIDENAMTTLVLLPARFTLLRDSAQTLLALEMHALLHFGVDPLVFRETVSELFGEDTSKIARLYDLGAVAQLFASVLSRDVFVYVLASREPPRQFYY